MAAQPTPAQRHVLELLTEFAALTTSQIAAYRAPPVTDRAVRRLLARLRAAGWIAGAPLYPERGAASEYYWTLRAAGARVLGVALPGPPLAPAALRRALLSPDAPPRLAPATAALLHLLADWQQLTTAQIAGALYPARPRWYTQQALRRLAARRCVRGTDLAPECGAAAEHYWTLLARGAQAIGVPYAPHYRRRPSAATLRWQGLQLDLIRQVATAGWSLIRPGHFSSAHPRPAESAQDRQLVAAVLAREGQALAALLAQGVAPAALQERLARYQAGQVGALVPPAVNDYVAYRPEQPAGTVVLIPHPPVATRSFWTRPPAPPSALSTQRGRPDSRIARYARLAATLPVIGVFPDAESAQAYGPLLEQAGLRAVAVDDLGALLTRDATPVPPRPTFLRKAR